MKEKIKTFEDVLSITGASMDDAPKMEEKNPLSKLLHATWMAALIAQAYNNNEIPDPTNHDKNRYFPWVIVDKDEEAASGFRFSDSLCDCDLTFTTVGPRLCFHRSADCMDAQSKFPEVYMKLFTK
jgi:hypothetical protein